MLPFWRKHEGPKGWQFWMYQMGWGEVLNYIGVEWEDKFEELEQLRITGM